MQGDAGADVLICGFGNDTLIGGDGADRFLFDSASDGTDQVTDFQVGTDTLALTGTAVSGLSLPDILTANLSSDGSGNAVFNFGSGNILTLVGVSASDLRASASVVIA